MIRVAIIDDQEMIRVGLTAVLDSFPDIDVVGAATDGLDALRVVDELVPDVVLMDIRMPGIDGVEATRRIRETHPAERMRILILTTYDNDQNVFAALRAGANGFLNKGLGPDELARGIREVHDGGGALSSAAASALIAHATTSPPVEIDGEMARRFDELTPREREIVEAIVAGARNEQIASALFLSPFTVKTHVNRAMAKVDARDRAQLVAFAFRAGIRG
ncbi:MAG TPA: response regulator transcription factor [Microbacterium sp.]|nr:response regulator transcription factor [Microbacterium sp.]